MEPNPNPSRSAFDFSMKEPANDNSPTWADLHPSFTEFEEQSTENLSQVPRPQPSDSGFSMTDDFNTRQTASDQQGPVSAAEKQSTENRSQMQRPPLSECDFFATGDNNTRSEATNVQQPAAIPEKQSTETFSQVQTSKQPEVALEENYLRMVHRSKVFNFDYRGDSYEISTITCRYACRPEDLMDHTFSEQRPGGPVLRLLVKQGFGEASIGVIRDVMLCELNACKTCPTDGSERHPGTFNQLPFAHARNTAMLGPHLSFSPRATARRTEVVRCDVSRKLVMYMNSDVPIGREEEPILSGVCVASTCAVCSPSSVREVSNKRSGQSLEGPGSKGQKDNTISGNKQVPEFGEEPSARQPARRQSRPLPTPGEVDENADHLRMAHFQDLEANVDRAGNLKPDQPRWRIKDEDTFAEGSPGWDGAEWLWLFLSTCLMDHRPALRPINY